ncbi:MAG: histidinol dehydrogenase, partial [Oscillospiraceae bacterium]|nr:histidinol dehydrogenase [Oscillospiraceae bacterium]
MVKTYIGADGYNTYKAEYTKSADTDNANITKTVAAVLADVKALGSTAVSAYAVEFDGHPVRKVSETEIATAYDNADSNLRSALIKCAENIKMFHAEQRRNDTQMVRGDVVLGTKVAPVETAGIYVPGGTAAYPSSVLMNALPAAVAGVKNIVRCTPPLKDGSANPDILLAAKIAQVTEIYLVGGAQAVAAMAYGATVPKCDVIVGPGNAYVAEAKRQVFGLCSIDMVAGPSEILILADRNANPRYIAADMMGQAEHDIRARAILVTDDKTLPERVIAELETQVKT